MSLDLLPNNSTKLERGIAHSSDPIPPLGTILERIRDGKRVNIPDAVVDWLIYEYGLGEVTPYLTDPRQALREGSIGRGCGAPQQLSPWASGGSTFPRSWRRAKGGRLG